MSQAFARLIYLIVLLVYYCFELVLWLKDVIVSTPFHRLRGHDYYPKRDWRWGQKLGVLPLNIKVESQQTALIHCASMGEVVAAMPLIKQLLDDKPQLSVVISTNTVTGQTQVARFCQSLSVENKQRVQQCYLPLDLPIFMALLLRRIHPEFVMIMEVELWPNLINVCARRQIPVFVINGRMTDKTTAGYMKLSWLSKPMISQLTDVFVRNEVDRKNYLTLGISAQRLHLVGNIKFDLPLPELTSNDSARRQWGILDRTVLIGGSTHLTEEATLLNSYRQLKEAYPALLLILVPRHPQRFSEVHDIVKQHELRVVKFTDLQLAKHQAQQSITTSTDVLLVDEMGVLTAMYELCDVAFVGGSFANKGGHNPIEPAVYGKPILMGPHIHNNPEICETLQASNALTICATPDAFHAKLTAYLEHENSRVADGRCGRLLLQQHAGLIQSILKTVYQGL